VEGEPRHEDVEHPGLPSHSGPRRWGSTRGSGTVVSPPEANTFTRARLSHPYTETVRALKRAVAKPLPSAAPVQARASLLSTGAPDRPCALGYADAVVQSPGWMRFALKVFPLGVALCVLSFSSTSAGAVSRGVGVCGSAVQKGTLPVWARAGFNPPTVGIPHVLGRSGAIVAILFHYPLQAPPPVNHNDKILWVSRVPYTWRATLRISAQRMNGTQLLGAPVQTNIKGGPGPSAVNLSTPGCWRFSLRWAGHTDSLDLQYRLKR
jgi:hypothetical protein